MRIAITGAHGVGKSTLAERLGRILDLPELPTPGRILAARGLPVNQSATISSQTVAWLLQYRLEREQPAWVAPRSLIDVWAYAVLAADRNRSDPLEQMMVAELAAATPLAMAGAYDELVLIPVGVPLVADDVRSADEGFQHSTDAAIQRALADWDVPHTRLDVRDSEAVEALIDRLARRQANAGQQ
jgi:nicotinamide riboside kinase